MNFKKIMKSKRSQGRRGWRREGNWSDREKGRMPGKGPRGIFGLMEICHILTVVDSYMGLYYSNNKQVARYFEITPIKCLTSLLYVLKAGGISFNTHTSFIWHTFTEKSLQILNTMSKFSNYRILYFHFSR